MIIQGSQRALDAVSWLKDRGWQFDVSVKNNNPFSGQYDFQLNNKEQEFIFKLTWVN